MVADRHPGFCPSPRDVLPAVIDSQNQHDRVLGERVLAEVRLPVCLERADVVLRRDAGRQSGGSQRDDTHVALLESSECRIEPHQLVLPDGRVARVHSHETDLVGQEVVVNRGEHGRQELLGGERLDVVGALLEELRLAAEDVVLVGVRDRDRVRVACGETVLGVLPLRGDGTGDPAVVTAQVA